MRLGLGLGLWRGRRGSSYEHVFASGTLPEGFTFTRSGTRDYLNASGVWTSAASNAPRFDSQPGVVGLLMAGARTNKVTAEKSNPSATTNCTTSGDAAGVLSIVDDSAALGAPFAKYGPNVFKVDNSAGSTAFYVRFGGTTGSTGVHSLSVIARGAGDLLLYDGTTETGATALDGASYARIKGNNKTPANTSQQLAVKCAAGEIAYVIVPHLELATFADPTPIPGGVGAITVNAETLVANRGVGELRETLVRIKAITQGAPSGSTVFYTQDDGTGGSTNFIALVRVSNGATQMQVYDNSGANVGSVVVGVIPDYTVFEIELRHTDGIVDARINGGSWVSVSGDVPDVALSHERLGHHVTNGDHSFMHFIEYEKRNI